MIFCYAENGDTNASAEQRGLSNHEFFSRLGKKLIAAISEVTEDGFSFRVDMALRPNGNSGPLVASFAMVEEYFMVQGREWERYAWVKARALTGKPLDILALDKIIRPFVYRRYLDYGVIDSLRSMHAQIRAEVIRQETRHPERSNNVKLGRGGIREIEFLSQVFQLIRGGREASLRDRSTRNTLRTLAEKNILESAVVDQLLTSYDFCAIWNIDCNIWMTRKHTFPAKEEDQLIIAQMMGYGSTRELLNELSLHRQFVAEQFDAIFKEKKSLKKTGDDSVLAATLSGADGDEMLEVYLVSLHFHDVPSAVKRLMSTWRAPRLQSLSDNNRNKLVAIINSALALIAKQSSGQLATLNRLLDFIEAIAKRSAYLALLTEYPYALERVVRMMGASDWAAKFFNPPPDITRQCSGRNSLAPRRRLGQF